MKIPVERFFSCSKLFMPGCIWPEKTSFPRMSKIQTLASWKCSGIEIEKPEEHGFGKITAKLLDEFSLLIEEIMSQFGILSSNAWYLGALIWYGGN